MYNKRPKQTKSYMFITGRSRIMGRNITLNSNQIRSYHIIKESGDEVLVRFDVVSVNNQGTYGTFPGFGGQAMWVLKKDLEKLSRAI